MVNIHEAPVDLVDDGGRYDNNVVFSGDTADAEQDRMYRLRKNDTRKRSIYTNEVTYSPKKAFLKKNLTHVTHKRVS